MTGRPLLFPQCLRFHKALFNYLFYKLYLQWAKNPLFTGSLEPNLQGFALNLQGFALQLTRFCAELARLCASNLQGFALNKQYSASDNQSQNTTSEDKSVNEFNKRPILEVCQEKVTLHQTSLSLDKKSVEYGQYWFYASGCNCHNM